MHFLPLFVDLKAGTIALVGGGPAARARLGLLRAAGATVRWFPREVDVAETLLLVSAPPGHVEVCLADPLQANFSEFAAVISATGCALDETIAERVRAAGKLINVVDR